MQSTNQYYPTHPGVPRQDSNTVPSHEHTTPRSTSVPTNNGSDPSASAGNYNYNYTSDNRYYTGFAPNPSVPVTRTITTNSTAGPHSSNLANRFDPRVDSDADRGAREGQYGPHNFRLANAADPRVDSDKDRRASPVHTHGITKPRGAGAVLDPSAVLQQHHQAQYPHRHHHPLQQSTSTPHPHETNTTRSNSTSGTLPNNDLAPGSGVGSSSSSAAAGISAPTNAMRALGGMGVGQQQRNQRMPGPAPNTVGPHRSDLLNKADPRVDSNQDGSKTLGRDKAVPR